MNTISMHASLLRRALPYLLGALLPLLPACKADTPADTSGQSFVYLDRLNYTLGGRGTTLLVKTNRPSDQPRSIAYRISGEAVRGVDFQLTDSTFVLPAGATEATISVQRLQEGDRSRSFQIALLPATDGSYELSLKSFSIVQVLSRAVYRQGFTQATGRLLSETTFGVSLSRNPSGRYRLDEPTRLLLEVDPSSTAREGEHFTFPEGREVIVPRRANSATFKLHFLKREEGHERLILRLVELDGFTDGANASLTIDLAGPEDFSGTWRLRSLANEDDLAGYGIIPSQLFTVDPNDQIQLTQTATGYQLTSSLQSALRHYFPATAVVPVTGEASLSANGNPAATVPYGELTIPDALVNFDPSAPTRRAAKAYFRLVSTPLGTELECLLNDYTTSAPSWADLYSYGMSSADAPLLLRFQRVTP